MKSAPPVNARQSSSCVFEIEAVPALYTHPPDEASIPAPAVIVTWSREPRAPAAMESVLRLKP